MTYSPGDQIYKYQLIEQIGKGEFGEVWRSTDTTLSRVVALKLLPIQLPSDIQNTLEEAVIGNKLSHENLVPIYAADVIQHKSSILTLIAQEYLPGGSIVKKATAGNFLTIPDALNALKGILRGLDYLHHANIFHNDIKPTNVLIGTRNQSVLTDYGIASISASGAPVAAKSMYLVHCAPETETTNRISIATDIYQVGITAYRLFNGISTVLNDFRRLENGVFQSQKRQGKIPDPNGYRPWIPPNLKKIVNKTCHPDPRQRYSSALELLRALEGLSYSGYWTEDGAGAFTGHGQNYEYLFDMLSRASGIETFATRKSKTTGRQNRITAFSHVGLNNGQAESQKCKFMQWVVKNG